MYNQTNHSVKGTLRGLHYQKDPHAQAKIVRVVRGKVLDVAVDLRHESPTFGKFHTVILDAERHNLFLIPRGFAHGFLALEDSIFTYNCSSYYNKESEGGIMWNDPEIGIYWNIDDPLVSDKDQELLTFAEYKADPAFEFILVFKENKASKKPVAKLTTDIHSHLFPQLMMVHNRWMRQLIY